MSTWIPGGSYAHPAYLTAAQVSIEPDGRFHVAFRFDVLAFALNDTSARIGNEPMEALLAAPPEELAATLVKAGTRLGRGFKLVTDAGDGRVESVDFPDAAQVRAWQEENKAVLPVVIPTSLSGRLPAGANTIACRFPSVLEQVILTLERPGEEPEAEAVEAGRVSTVWPIRLAVSKVAGTKATASQVKNTRVPQVAVGAFEILQQGWMVVLAGLIVVLAMTWLLTRRQRKTAAPDSRS